MGRRKKMVERVTTLMNDPQRIRNIGIVAHIDHGKTTLSDNLLAGAGMISKELAGRQLFMDSDEEEQSRGITIDASNVSMVHTFDNEDYLINLIDTPGHVDFGGDVTRAMRAVDGAVVVVDAVEGTMPQTETVLRQALREHVRPVLFVNKVDRLINELQVDSQEMQVRLGKVIDHVNKLIKNMNPEKFKAGWKVDAAAGTVAFGSALYNWAISVPMMKKTGVSFNDVYEYCKAGDMKTLAEKCPLHEAVLDMVIHFLPNPLVAQQGRVKVIWHGDENSEVGKSMTHAHADGDLAFMVTDISVDPHAGEVATGRLFSGSLTRGMEVYTSGTAKKSRVQQVGIFMGPERLEVDKIPAGNIAAVTGLKDAIVGSTVTTLDGMTPFESIRHVSEPVVTVAVEAKHTKDLPKLIEVLRQVAKEDPTLQITLDEETGEHLMAGMGELHLEVIAHRIERDKNVEITTSKPIVVYRETIKKKTEPIEGKSPNRHNRFYISVEPLDLEIVSAIKEGEITMNMPELERRQKLIELGMDKEQAKGIAGIFNSNIFIDQTKGIQYLNETMELVLDGFEEVMRAGPLTREPVANVKCVLVDAKLHEDAIHRGPAQIIQLFSASPYSGINRITNFPVRSQEKDKDVFKEKSPEIF
ncbi:Translation elongation factor 2 [Methanosarcina mazei Tuc01]|uniref:Elongation factor 2 n=1 Tax=Methanosarcina mazei Tuc01 TaxID=1236903 RepID=M1PZ56_METMZ|nr:elongation factor EF-2 [Methanosarcina mazei]AGF97631.1 Translation elongation factor 2 [Methanosarcina mazei Tuc01]